MSSLAGYCKYCSKPVMHKTLFGTLHFCLTEEERAVVDQQQLMISKPLASLIEKQLQIAQAYRKRPECR